MNGTKVTTEDSDWKVLVDMSADMFIDEFSAKNGIHGEYRDMLESILKDNIRAKFNAIDALILSLAHNVDADIDTRNRLEDRIRVNMCKEVSECRTFALTEFQDACERAFQSAKAEILG